jgi:hypothetical protein
MTRQRSMSLPLGFQVGHLQSLATRLRVIEARLHHISICMLLCWLQWCILLAALSPRRRDTDSAQRYYNLQTASNSLASTQFSQHILPRAMTSWILHSTGILQPCAEPRLVHRDQ